MLFRKDYAAPGPGLDPNAPEKTGIARLIEILQIECTTLVKLNLLVLLSCLPIITIPPAIFAMNTVVRRMVRDETVDCFYHYRTAFKKHWKTAYGAFFLTALPLAGGGFGLLFYLRYAMNNLLFLAPFLLCSTVFLVTMLASTYLYGLLSLGWSLREAVKPAVLYGVGKPLRAGLAALCVYGSLLATVLEFPLSAIYLLFLGLSVPCLLANFFLRTTLKQYFDT